MNDAEWMRHAIRLAQRAERQGEVPIGALVVFEGRCVGEGWNQPIQLHDPSAHAEIQALRQAGRKLGNYRLPGSSLYVTLEPCVMCMGAIVHARMERLVFGAFDARRGAVCGPLQLGAAEFLNHSVVCDGGVLAEECGGLLADFFRARRRPKS